MQNILSRTRCVIAITILAAIAGCGGSDDRAAPGTGGDEDVYLIGVSQCTLDEPWLEQVNADIKTAAEGRPNLKLIFKNARGDTLKQQADLEDFVDQRVDLIIVNPNQPVALAEPVAEIVNARTPVIVLHRPLIGKQYTCFIRADDEKIGAAAGNWLADKLGGRGKIVELKGAYGSKQAGDRHRGFRAALRDPSFRVIFEAHVNSQQSNARREMEKALELHDEIDAVFAHNDAGAHGAYLAAKAAGREKDIIFLAIGASLRNGIDYVKQGSLDAWFQYPTGGAEAIGAAMKILSGKGEDVPKTIVLDSRLFTRQNVDQGGEPLE